MRLPLSVALSVALAIGVAMGPRRMPDDTAADAEDETAAFEADVAANEDDPLLLAGDVIAAAADEAGDVVVGSFWRGRMASRCARPGTQLPARKKI